MHLEGVPPLQGLGSAVAARPQGVALGYRVNAPLARGNARTTSAQISPGHRLGMTLPFSPPRTKGAQPISPGQRPGSGCHIDDPSPEGAKPGDEPVSPADFGKPFQSSNQIHPAMPQSLSKVLVHLVFSTKSREPMIAQDTLPRLHGYIAGILDHLKSPSIQTGGVVDHVHILFALNRTLSQADIVEEVKKSSSKWMKTHGGVPGFSWQAGYGAFSVGESQVDTVRKYIQNQEEHHRKVTFQEEYRRFLERYKVPYDERYVWD
jgi:REP element-mobilizing transposase RayT